MLFGERDAIRTIRQVDNVARNPEREFEIDPAPLFAALRAERAGGAKLVGYWHSHPGGDASPSATDAAMAAPDGKIWVIAGGGEITAWRATIQGFVALAVEITD